MLAKQQYTSEPRSSSILPALDVDSVVWFVNPAGDTHTGQIEELSLVDGIWWAACRYEQLPGVWALENRHAANFFADVGPEFPLQIGQPVWFKRRNGLQGATVASIYLEDGEWFAVLEWPEWWGKTHEEKPICEVHTIRPELDEEPEYTEFESKADYWADYKYEDRLDNR